MRVRFNQSRESLNRDRSFLRLFHFRIIASRFDGDNRGLREVLKAKFESDWARLWRDTKIACKDISLTGGRGSNTLEGAYCSSGFDDWR